MGAALLLEKLLPLEGPYWRYVLMILIGAIGYHWQRWWPKLFSKDPIIRLDIPNQPEPERFPGEIESNAPACFVRVPSSGYFLVVRSLRITLPDRHANLAASVRSQSGDILVGEAISKSIEEIDAHAVPLNVFGGQIGFPLAIGPKETKRGYAVFSCDAKAFSPEKLFVIEVRDYLTKTTTHLTISVDDEEFMLGPQVTSEMATLLQVHGGRAVGVDLAVDPFLDGVVDRAVILDDADIGLPVVVKVRLVEGWE